MALHKTKGLVLQSRDYTETSKLVNFLTPDCGQIKTLAKGARRRESKLRGRLELFNYGHLVFYQSRTSDLHILGQFDLIESFPPVRATLAKSALAYYMAELAASASYGAEQSRYLLQLLLHVLRKADAIGSLPDARLWFEVRFLYGLGVFPPTGRCSRCGKQHGRRSWFSPWEKGWLCADCRGSDRQATPIAPGLSEAIDYLLEGDLTRGQKLKLSPAQLEALQSIVRYLIDSQLGKKLRSRKFLQQVSGA